MDSKLKSYRSPSSLRMVGEYPRRNGVIAPLTVTSSTPCFFCPRFRGIPPPAIPPSLVSASVRFRRPTITKRAVSAQRAERLSVIGRSREDTPNLFSRQADATARTLPSGRGFIALAGGFIFVEGKGKNGNKSPHRAGWLCVENYYACLLMSDRILSTPLHD